MMRRNTREKRQKEKWKGNPHQNSAAQRARFQQQARQRALRVRKPVNTLRSAWRKAARFWAATALPTRGIISQSITFTLLQESPKGGPLSPISRLVGAFIEYRAGVREIELLSLKILWALRHLGRSSFKKRNGSSSTSGPGFGDSSPPRTSGRGRPGDGRPARLPLREFGRWSSKIIFT